MLPSQTAAHEDERKAKQVEQILTTQYPSPVEDAGKSMERASTRPRAVMKARLRTLDSCMMVSVC